MEAGLASLEEHPVAGTGAGSFGFTNLRYRTSSLDRGTEPHSLPVQFLTETGAVGLMLFVLAGAGLVGAARRRPGPQLALALALPAYLMHGLIDIDWDFAAVTAPVFLIAGAVAARPPGAEPAKERSAIAAGPPGVGGRSARRPVLALRRVARRPLDGAAYETWFDRPAHAVALAKRARSVNPLSVEPLFAQALAEQRRGNLAEALGLLQEATRLQPENKESWFALGEFDLRVRNCPRTALPELDRFTQLDPQNPGNTEYDRALKLVNSGTPVC